MNLKKMYFLLTLCWVVSPDSAVFQPFLESSFQQVYEMRDVSHSGWLVGPITPFWLMSREGHFVVCVSAYSVSLRGCVCL